MTTDERMEKMEGQLARVRWFNRCLIACIVMSLGAWFIVKTFGPETAWAQSGAKVIRATRFVVEDENGKLRAVLEANKNGPSLMLYDENGMTRVGLAAHKGGPKLVLLDENDKLRVALSVLKDGAELSLLDENRKPRTVLSMTDEDGPWLSLLDENGKARAGLGESVLSLKDEHDKFRVILGVGKNGPKLALKDENGKLLWSAP